MSPAAADAYRLAEASSVQHPYLGLAAALVLLAVAIAAFKLPKIEDVTPAARRRRRRRIARAPGATATWCSARSAIFVYVGGEVAIGSFLVNYFKEPSIGGLTESAGAKLVSFYWGGAMVGRFIGTRDAAHVQAGQGADDPRAGRRRRWSLLTMATHGSVAMWSIIAVGLFNSIMFPTIFTLAIEGLGKHTSQGSGILCMAIVGGAIIPVVQGALADAIGIHHGFVVAGALLRLHRLVRPLLPSARQDDRARRLGRPRPGRLEFRRGISPAVRRSDALLKGINRAPARAMLKATGLKDADLDKPLIAVANTWTDATPCNMHLRDLAVHVKEGIRAAGGTPIEFNTVVVSDGISMGTEGMRASLVSREVIADSIELAVRGAMCDGVVALSGCDKTIPGTMMALARLDVPGLMLYGGSIMPGNFRGKRDDPGGVRGGRRLRRRPDHRERAARAGGRGLPRRRRLRWSVHRQHDVDGGRDAGDLADGAERHPGRRRAQERGGDARRQDRHAPGHRGLAAQQDPDPGGVRERHHRRRHHGRARPTPCCI